jgi:hypothetical protein
VGVGGFALAAAPSRLREVADAYLTAFVDSGPTPLTSTTVTPFAIA